MTAQDIRKTKASEQFREQAFREGYEAGYRAAWEKYAITKEPLPEVALEYARKVYRLEGVERVYAKVNKVLYLHTEVQDANDDALMRLIFEVEGQTYDAFPEHGYEIDFLLMGETRRSEDSLERSDYSLIPRETSVAVG